MRVVIVGASGNVGTSLLESLARDEQVSEVLALARRVPEGALFEKTTWAAADVVRDDLAPLFAGADAVVHLAWLIQPSRDERTTAAVNIRGSERVLGAVSRARVPALVYGSSVGAYSPGPDGGRVDESWPTEGIPSSFYSRHKAQVERLVDRFESEHPDVRVVRMRPGLIFKRAASSEIRRLFVGPLLPGWLARPEGLPLLPLPRGIRVQAVHSLDVGRAYARAITHPVSGAFNIAAEPVLDAATIAATLGTRPLELPPRALRAVADASWRLRLQPTSPGWLDMGMAAPLMDTTRASRELGFVPTARADETLRELVRGIRAGAGFPTPPLDPHSGGALRWREFASGVGARA